MKRILSLVLAVLMLLSLCACTSSSLASEETAGATKETQAETKEAKETGPIVYPEGFSAGFGRTDITPEIFPVDLEIGRAHV